MRDPVCTARGLITRQQCGRVARSKTSRTIQGIEIISLQPTINIRDANRESMWTVCEADLPKLSVMVSFGKLGSKIAILIAYFYNTFLKSDICAWERSELPCFFMDIRSPMRKPKVGADPGSYAFVCPHTKRANLVQVLSTFSLSMASSLALSSKKVDSDVLGFLLQLDNLEAREESSTTLNYIRFCMDTDCETNAAEQPSMRRHDFH